MKSRIRLFVIFVAVSGIASIRILWASDCLSYEATASLAGILITEPALPRNLEFYEPGEIPGRQYILRLDNPICLNQRADDIYYDKSRTDVSEIALLQPSTGADDWPAFLDKRVIMKGELWGAQTGHHAREVMAGPDKLVIAPVQ